MPLNVNTSAARPDDIYQSIIDMHDGLSEEESATANARLILILANHIGDADIIAQATKIARGKVQPDGQTRLE